MESVESNSQLAALESESMFPDSFSEPPLHARDNNSDSSRNDDAQPPSPKRSQFQSAIDEELSVAAAGIVPKNTESNNQWALRNFEAWRVHYNRRYPDALCPEDILLTNDASELDQWLSRFVLETRKEDNSPFPPRSIKLILPGLLRHMRAKSQSPFNIFQKDDHPFQGSGQLLTPSSRSSMLMVLEHM